MWISERQTLQLRACLQRKLVFIFNFYLFSTELGCTTTMGWLLCDTCVCSLNHHFYTQGTFSVLHIQHSEPVSHGTLCCRWKLHYGIFSQYPVGYTVKAI